MLTTLSNVFSATSAMVPSTGIDGVACATDVPVGRGAPVRASPTAARPASAFLIVLFMASPLRDWLYRPAWLQTPDPGKGCVYSWLANRLAWPHAHSGVRGWHTGLLGHRWRRREL